MIVEVKIYYYSVFGKGTLCARPSSVPRDYIQILRHIYRHSVED